MKKLSVIFLSISLWIVAGAGQAQSLLISMAPGFAMLDAAGIHHGATVDVVDELERRMKVGFDRKYLPPARCLSDFIEGKADILPFVQDPRMDEYGANAGLIVVVPQIAVTPKERLLLGFDDLYTLNAVGIVRGTVPLGPLVEDPKIKRQEIPDVDTGLRMLMNRRLDAIVASKIGMMTTLHNHKMESWVSWVKVGEMPMGFYLNKKHSNTPLFNILQESLKTMREDGAIEDIMDKHFGPFWREGT